MEEDQKGLPRMVKCPISMNCYGKNHTNANITITNANRIVSRNNTRLTCQLRRKILEDTNKIALSN